MDGFEEFEFDLPKALRENLILLLDSMETGTLDRSVTANVPEVQGVYQLFREDELVYIGKTDADAGLRTRLSRHASKISHRPNLVGQVKFKAVRILVFTAMDLETALIKHYRQSGPVAWNGSGFGSNDPGRRREETDAVPEGFDMQFPINIDLPIEPPLNPGQFLVITALSRIKANLPYTLRYETLRDARGRAQRGVPHPELITPAITVGPMPQTTRQLMKLIVNALGSSWQATVFPSHIILYKESKTYTHGSMI